MHLNLSTCQTLNISISREEDLQGNLEFVKPLTAINIINFKCLIEDFKLRSNAAHK